jgi:hypothetical protein
MIYCQNIVAGVETEWRTGHNPVSTACDGLSAGLDQIRANLL